MTITLAGVLSISVISLNIGLIVAAIGAVGLAIWEEFRV